MQPKFLVIEDDADTRELVKAMLESLDCSVVLAEDGTKGMEKLNDQDEAKSFDAIFLDLMLPDVSGYGVIEMLKKQEHTRKIPVIMITAKGSGDDVITGYQFGADYYIPKPFTREQIIFGLDIVLGEDQEEPEEEVQISE